MTTFADLERAREKRGGVNPPVDPNQVRKVQCKSCPFGKYGDAIGSEAGIEVFARFQANLVENALNKHNQQCHADELAGKFSTHVCRGARDIQLQFFCILGAIESPTDESWAKALKKLGIVK